MQIKSLYLQQLANIMDQKLIFDVPERNDEYFNNLKVSILVGENGTGKTSILTFLANAFFYLNKSVRMNRDFQKFYDLEYIIDDQLYHLSPDFLATDMNQLLPRRVIVSSCSLNEKFNRHMRSERVDYVYAGNRMSPVLSLIEANRKTDKKVASLLELIGYSNSFQIGIDHRVYMDTITKYLRKGKTIRNLKIEDLEYLHYFLRNLGEYYERPDRSTILLHPVQLTDRWIKAAKTVEEHHSLGLTLYFLKNDRWIRMSEMSSGEQVMIRRFAPLINSLCDDSLVLIDEPETNLHPAWIQKYVYILTELFSEYHAHIILATHSPLIPADVPRECIVGLVRDFEFGARVKQYVAADTTLGSDPSNILRDVFGLEQTMGKFTTNIFNRIIELVRKNQIDTALQLYDNLGTSVDKFELYDEMVKIRPEEFE